MKLKIKVKVFKDCCTPKIIEKGEWIDLMSRDTISLTPSQSGVLKKKVNEGEVERYRNVISEVTYIPLGIAVKLPKGFEAIIVPRSSTPKSFGLVCANSFGVIDNSYSGNTDEWKFPAIAIRPTTIEEGDKICQFRIQLSQKATFIQKLKWLFSSGIKLEVVETLDNKSRGGFGSTGKK